MNHQSNPTYQTYGEYIPRNRTSRYDPNQNHQNNNNNTKKLYQNSASSFYDNYKVPPSLKASNNQPITAQLPHLTTNRAVPKPVIQTISTDHLNSQQVNAIYKHQRSKSKPSQLINVRDQSSEHSHSHSDRDRGRISSNNNNQNSSSNSKRSISAHSRSNSHSHSNATTNTSSSRNKVPRPQVSAAHEQIRYQGQYTKNYNSNTNSNNNNHETLTSNSKSYYSANSNLANYDNIVAQEADRFREKTAQIAQKQNYYMKNHYQNVNVNADNKNEYERPESLKQIIQKYWLGF